MSNDTSANTGHFTSACIQLQMDIGHPILSAECFHHIGEVILTHVWNCLEIEVSKSPEITIFQRFRAVYTSLSTGDLENLSFPDITFTDILSQEEVCSLISIELVR